MRSDTSGLSRLKSARKLCKDERDLIHRERNVSCIVRHGNTPYDVWLFRQDFGMKNVVLQKGETTDAKYVSAGEIRTMICNNEFTPLRTRGGWVYLTVVLDLYDRKVLGWSLSAGLDAASAAVAAFAIAARNRPPNPA